MFDAGGASEGVDEVPSSKTPTSHEASRKRSRRKAAKSGAPDACADGVDPEAAFPNSASNGFGTGRATKAVSIEAPHDKETREWQLTECLDNVAHLGFVLASPSNPPRHPDHIRFRLGRTPRDRLGPILRRRHRKLALVDARVRRQEGRERPIQRDERVVREVRGRFGRCEHDVAASFSQFDEPERDEGERGAILRIRV